jgi:hypothetical protein
MMIGSVSAASQVNVTVGSAQTGSNNLSLGYCISGESAYLNEPTLRQLAVNANFKLVRIISTDIEPCSYWNDATKTGTFNWATVDKVIQAIFATGAQPLITLGYHNSYTGWKLPPGMGLNSVTGLPDPNSFAAYCSQWVQHFKSTGANVLFYEIINEPWSYFGWNNYTLLGYYKTVFNAAAAAMKNVNPNVLVSFDGTNRKPVLNYWLSNGGANLGFISFHKYDESTIGEYNDATMLSEAETFQLQSDSCYYGVQDAQQVYYNARGKLIPVINSESNFDSAYATGTDPKIQQMVGAVWTALVLRTEMLVGLNYNCYYSISSSASNEEKKSSGGVGFGLINSDNCLPWYPYYVNMMIGISLAVGDPIIQTTSSSDNVQSIAWLHGTKEYLLLICKVNQPCTVQLSGLQGAMNYSKIDNTFSWKTPQLQTGSINPNTPISMIGYTVMLLEANISSSPDPSPTSTITFADGFESGNFNAWTGTSVTSGETATVVNTVKHSGTYSAEFTSNGGSSYENAYCYENVASAQELYASSYVYVAASGITVSNDRFYFTILQANGNPVAYVGWRMVGSVVEWDLLIRDGTGWVDAYNSSSVSLNQWISVELHWKSDSSAGLGQLFVNNILVCSISSRNTAYYGAVTSASFGLPELCNCASTQVYCDDCALSGT